MKRVVLIVVPVLILAALIVWRFEQKKTQGVEQGGQRAQRMQGGASVELIAVQRRDIARSYAATGTVESMQSVKITPKISGLIEWLQVREGDRVRQGQVLVRIDQSDVLANVRAQEAALAETKYRLAQAQLNQTPTDVAVATQVRQQEAAVASAAADEKQAVQTRTATLAAIASTLDEAQSKIDSAAASVANAHATIKSAQANLDNADAKLRRAEGLYQKGFVSAQQVDDARTAVSVQQAALEAARGQLQSANAALAAAKAQQQTAVQNTAITRAKADADVEAAKARVTQAQAALDYARANVKQSPAFQQNLEALKAHVAAAQAALDSARNRVQDTVLRSPLDGVITARMVDQGALATSGQPILTVQSLQRTWITFAVPEEINAGVRLGQPATVAFDALGGQRFPARVVQINPSADTASRQFTVRAVLARGNDRISPGMFAHVTLITEQRTQVPAVPLEAVEQAPDGSKHVFVAGEDNTARRRPVTTGLADAQWVEITAGLAPQERVVTMSAMPLRDGQALRTGGGRRGQGGATAVNEAMPDHRAGGSAVNRALPHAPSGERRRPAGE